MRDFSTGTRSSLSSRRRPHWRKLFLKKFLSYRRKLVSVGSVLASLFQREEGRDTALYQINIVTLIQIRGGTKWVFFHTITAVIFMHKNEIVTL